VIGKAIARALDLAFDRSVASPIKHRPGPEIEPSHIMIEEITPKHLRCSWGSCPSIFQANDGDWVIIGKQLSDEVLAQVQAKIGRGEYAIKISPEYFMNLIK
jgi:hypothetical protein